MKNMKVTIGAKPAQAKSVILPRTKSEQKLNGPLRTAKDMSRKELLADDYRKNVAPLNGGRYY